MPREGVEPTRSLESAPMPLTAGSRLGPYEILAPLGAGGMGEVYRARDAKLARDIAIKVLPSETSADPERRKRFEQEARSASALNHPNILTIYDIGAADGTIYIAMELVEGRTLRELLATGEPLPTKRLLDVAVQTADGLAKAHGAGIVHRDLKPENLMISRDGFVKILDFGLAKLTENPAQDASVLPTAIASPTQPGTVMGTVGYMSPEQASGQPVDFRSDQFTLGAIVYEMATGKRAFQRKTSAETLVAVIREEPDPLQQQSPKAPPPLRWIVERCLAKDPEERYASTKDLARDLRSVRDHLSEASISGAIEATGPIRLRRRGWLLPAVLALVAGAAIALIAGKRAHLFTPAPPEYQRLTFRRGTILNARFAPDGNTVVYGAAWEGGAPEIYSTRPEGPESKSLGLPSANVLAVSHTGDLAISLGWHPLSGWESSGTLARVPLSGGAPRELLENVQDADWSLDGKNLAVSRQVGSRVRLEYPTGTVLTEATGWLSDPRISPDGQYVAFIEHPERGDSAGRLVIFDIARHSKVEVQVLSGGTGLAWRRNEVVFGDRGALKRASTSGKVSALISMPGGFNPQDISADGRLLATRTNYRREFVGLAPGDTRERNLTWLDWSFPSDVSADGRTVLFDEQSRARADYSAYVRKTDGSPAVLLGTARSLAFSPDGRWALTTNVDSSQLTLLPTGAGAPRTLPKTNLLHQSATFLADGRGLLLCAVEKGHGPRLYVQDLDGQARAITGEGYELSGRALSPDGKTAAARGPDRKIQLVAIPSGQARPLPGAHEEESPIGWTADGGSLYLDSGEAAIPAHVEICDVTTGARRPWKDLTPPDPAGVVSIGPIFITPDGKSYVYSYRRMLEDLYLVRGLP